MNPSLLGSVAPAGYELHVPEGAKESVTASLATIPAERRASWRVHRVAPGDTMESIARRFNMPVNSIASLNSQSEAEIGDVLIIPTASQLERMKKTSTKKLAGKNSGKPVAKASGKSAVRTVKNAKRPATRRMASAYVNSARLD
jgi:membrane-bound lytic murein transglycosylase D